MLTESTVATLEVAENEPPLHEALDSLESSLDLSERGRANHYERAFAAYVRTLRAPCVPIDQNRRPIEGRASGLKNPDFLVYPLGRPNLIVEVKGKRAKDPRGKRRWENWVTTQDLDGLIRWQAMYGPGFRALLTFVYEDPPVALSGQSNEPALPEGDGTFLFEGRFYRFWAIALDDYLRRLQSRGEAWKAVAMARAAFRRRVRPLIDWLPASRPLDPARPRPQPRPQTSRLRRSGELAPSHSDQSSR